MMITQAQLEAIAEVQQGLMLINRIWDKLQAVSVANDLDMSFASLHQLGLVLRQCQNKFSIANSERAARDVLEYVEANCAALGPATDPANAFLFVRH